jgi:hypothetical protein
MPIPFDQMPIGEGLLPDGTRVPFFINAKELRALQDEGPAWKYHDARFIEEAVSNPDAIFEGCAVRTKTMVSATRWRRCTTPTRNKTSLV